MGAGERQNYVHPKRVLYFQCGFDQTSMMAMTIIIQSISVVTHVSNFTHAHIAHTADCT